MRVCAEPGCDERSGRYSEFCQEHCCVKDLSDPAQLEPRKMGTINAQVALALAVHRLADAIESKKVTDES
jgi:hypothetical protein